MQLRHLMCLPNRPVHLQMYEKLRRERFYELADSFAGIDTSL